MSYEKWMSLKYTRAKKDKFLAFLNFISISGIAIGVASLIVVLSVMTGFGNNLREKIVGTTPHIMIEKETYVQNFDSIIENILNIDNIKAASPYVQGNVFLERKEQTTGLILRGIDPQRENAVTNVGQFIKEGSLEDLVEENVIVGSELARYYGFHLGDDLTIIAPTSGIAGKDWRYTLKIVGIFKTGMVDFDTNLILTSFKQAQSVFQLADNVSSGIGISLDVAENAGVVKQDLYKNIGYAYVIKTWIDMNRSLFEALFLEKWGLFLILILMVLVASFNIISTLIVMVTSNIKDIGILKALGASKKSIKSIFMKQGFHIGLVGVFWGLVSGTGFCYILKNYVKVPVDIYFIDHVPVEIQISDICVIVVSALVITYCATIYPASKAAALQPVEALKYR